MRLWLFLFSLFFVSAFITSRLIVYLKKTNIMDVPNERSSHQIPTPRGGGLAIIITFFFGLFAIYYKSVVSDPIFLSLLLGGSMVALVGWLDDKGSIKIKWRLLVHFVSACVAIGLIKNLPELPLQRQFEWLVYVGYVVGVFAIVWSINLFNFMDGINGLAGSEAAFVSGSAALILLLNGQDFHAASLLVVFFCSAGFLVYNVPKAKIFLGDAGSGFLGFLIAVYAIGISYDDGISPWSWVILYGYFIADSTVTLVTRMLTGQKWTTGHSLHAYQKLARRMGSHARVTLLVAMINVFWLLPWALFATQYANYSTFAAGMALLPLVVWVILLRAGER